MYLIALVSYFFKNCHVAALHSHPNPNPHLCFLDCFSESQTSLSLSSSLLLSVSSLATFDLPPHVADLLCHVVGSG